MSSFRITGPGVVERSLPTGGHKGVRQCNSNAPPPRGRQPNRTEGADGPTPALAGRGGTARKVPMCACRGRCLAARPHWRAGITEAPASAVANRPPQLPCGVTSGSLPPPSVRPTSKPFCALRAGRQGVCGPRPRLRAGSPQCEAARPRSRRRRPWEWAEGTG